MLSLLTFFSFYSQLAFFSLPSQIFLLSPSVLLWACWTVHFTYMLLCNILKVEAYFHHMCTSETVPYPRPLPFISHTLSLSPATVFFFFLTQPVFSAPPPLYSFYLTWSLCITSYSPQRDISSFIFNSIIHFRPISYSQTGSLHSHTVHHSFPPLFFFSAVCPDLCGT